MLQASQVTHAAETHLEKLLDPQGVLLHVLHVEALVCICWIWAKHLGGEFDMELKSSQQVCQVYCPDAAPCTCSASATTFKSMDC